MWRTNIVSRTVPTTMTQVRMLVRTFDELPRRTSGSETCWTEEFNVACSNVEYDASLKKVTWYR